jgi:uncharacterized protein YecE (DUF72 family)
MEPRCLIGTSGWNYPHWRERFYPRGLPPDKWLAFYAERFPTVEVNYSFYQLPRSTSFSAWRAAVPATFRFAVKASRFITHIKRLRESREPITLLLRRAEPLGQTLGPILFQLAPTFACDEERLATFLAGLPADHLYAFEFRHESWHRESVYRLMREHHAACCVADGPTRPRHIVRTAPFVYVRLHNSGVGKGSYTDEQLRWWAGQILDLSEGGTAYVYFNNDWEAYAVANAMRLTELLSVGAAAH